MNVRLKGKGDVFMSINTINAMKSTVKKFVGGVKPVYWLAVFFRWLVRYIKYSVNYFTMAKFLADGRFAYGWFMRYPCLNDATGMTGFDAHYVYHTGWAARIVTRLNPEYHVDISSLLWFVTIASASVPIHFYDYRPADVKLPGLTCGKADLTNLPFEDNSVKSLSCLHVMEHIGLGRYGDPFDPSGDLKGISELKRVLSKDGHLLFVVPIGGIARMQFNAHRIYTFAQIKEYFAGLELREFAMITDGGDFIENASEEDVRGQKYACGCFLFQKA